MGMRILAVTDDTILSEKLNACCEKGKNEIIIISTRHDGAELLSTILIHHPRIIILDDDFVKPHSISLIKSVQKLTRDSAIIFVTSDSCMELGREVSQLGLHYYGIKPFFQDEMCELLKSFYQKQVKTIVNK